MSEIKKYIRSIPDFPKKGIMFRDITTLLKSPEAMKLTLKELMSFTDGIRIDKVVGIESRGFMFGAMIAERLNAGFIPVRKPKKLPAETISETYALEYGTDTIEMHKDAIDVNDNVLIHDDLLATGGTARAAANLVEKAGGRVVQLSFIVELSFLNGRSKFDGYNVRALVDYPDEEP